MAVASVYSILAVLIITIVSTTSFPSDISESMTPAERLEVFGSADSVPEYEVFPMSLSRMRHSAKSHKKIKLKLKLDGKIIILKLKRTAGYLASKYTPVWTAKTDKRAFKNIRYKPRPTAMTDVGKFKMYHDIEKEAAITVFTDPEEGTIIEGIVTPYYAIRSLPKRLMKKTLKIGDYVIKVSDAKKRSIISDPDEDTGYFVLVKIPAASENATRIHVHGDDLHREKRFMVQENERKVPKAVYPEILLILDHNAIRTHTMTQALRFMLAFWNAVDLVYSVFDKPKVHLNIAGIIISKDDFATPYITKNTATTKFDYVKASCKYLVGHYFLDETVRFPVNRYDMIVAMTTADMCEKSVNPCRKILGIATLGAACGTIDFHYNMETGILDRSKGTAFIHYNWKFGGVDTAAHETAHLFNIDHDVDKEETDDCNVKEYVMSAASKPRQPFKWSICSRNFLKTFFSSQNSKCLDNKPQWSKPVKEILPGMTLSMDAQCQNYGYEKSCKPKKYSICARLGCRHKLHKCIRQRRVPLAGSPCGHHKYCNSKKKCTHE